MGARTYCNARTAPFPIESCCDKPFMVSPPDKVCRNCGEAPTIKAENPRMGESICALPAGHRGRHSWAR